jgi:hypothetical protein
MSTQGNLETSRPPLSTADLAAAGRPTSVAGADADSVPKEDRVPAADKNNEILSRSLDATETRPAPDADSPDRVDAASERDTPPSAPSPVASAEALEPLFTPELAQTYRSRWGVIQGGFVDDPRRAVRSGDELVAQIMTNLANTFAEERHRVEAQLDDSGDGSTENLRVALRRYRSFFERLLSL